MVLRNVNSGAFEVYDIAGNTTCRSRELGCGRFGLAAGRLRGQFSDRCHGQLGRLNLSTRASDGRFRRRRRRWELERWTSQCGDITADAADDTAAPMRAARRQAGVWLRPRKASRSSKIRSFTLLKYFATVHPGWRGLCDDLGDSEVATVTRTVRD